MGVVDEAGCPGLDRGRCLVVVGSDVESWWGEQAAPGQQVPGQQVEGPEAAVSWREERPQGRAE